MKYDFKNGDLLRYTPKIDKKTGTRYYCVVINVVDDFAFVYWITSPSNKCFHQTISWHNPWGYYNKVA